MTQPTVQEIRDEYARTLMVLADLDALVDDTDWLRMTPAEQQAQRNKALADRQRNAVKMTAAELGITVQTVIDAEADAPDREAWSAPVQAMLDNYADAPREALSFLAKLLEHDMVPANGRTFIAEHLKGDRGRYG